jgi:hypothetical protein
MGVVVCSRAMQDPSVTPPAPQFDTAEYAHVPGSERCQFCKQPLATNYFRVNGVMACASCADQAQRNAPKDSHVAFSRAVFFGVGAAILGMILYATFAILTGWVIGYLSLAVGYLVGKAMMKGSGGLGGRRYQIAAVLLTYAAVSMSAIPVGIAVMRKEHKEQTNSAQTTADASSSEQSGQAPKEKMSVGKALAYLGFLGLASPFLELQDPVHGLIGLVILFVGIQIAWKLTAGAPRAEVTGPY